jgi:hypothetical protein
MTVGGVQRLYVDPSQVNKKQKRKKQKRKKNKGKRKREKHINDMRVQGEMTEIPLSGFTK